MAGFVRIGQIVGAHGLKGQVKVAPLTDFGDRFRRGARLRLGDDWVTVESFVLHKGRPLLKLSGIDDMEPAQAQQWQYLEAQASRPELEEDEFLTEDLIGMKVRTEAGEDLGEVDDVLAMPAHDVLQVGELLIPAVKEFVRDVNLDEEVIVVRLIPGMRPGEDSD